MAQSRGDLGADPRAQGLGVDRGVEDLAPEILDQAAVDPVLDLGERVVERVTHLLGRLRDSLVKLHGALLPSPPEQSPAGSRGGLLDAAGGGARLLDVQLRERVERLGGL